MHEFFRAFADEQNGDQLKRAGDPEDVPDTKTGFYRWIVDAIWKPLQQLLAGKARSATATTGGGLLAGATVNVPLTWSPPLPNGNYNVVPVAASGNLFYVSTSTKTVSGCTVTLRNGGLSALASGGVAVEFTIIPFSTPS